MFNIKANGRTLSEYLIPKLLILSMHSSAKIRAHAIASLFCFVPLGLCPAFSANINRITACLFTRVSDEDPSVRSHVCRVLAAFLQHRPIELTQNIATTAEHMLNLTQDCNSNVALQACEFWLVFAGTPDLASDLRPFLGKVVPVLLGFLPYGENELRRLRSHDYAEVENNAYNDSEWNLRKSAAASLDMCAVRFGTDLLRIVLKPLWMKLRSEDWLEKESAILALGAIAEGADRFIIDQGWADEPVRQAVKMRLSRSYTL